MPPYLTENKFFTFLFHSITFPLFYNVNTRETDIFDHRSQQLVPKNVALKLK